jgi:Protein of unknown function (DUF3455)
MSKRPVPSREVVQENRFNRHEPASGRSRGKLPIASAVALAAALTALLPQLARAGEEIVPPAVPDAIKLKVPAEPFLLGHGVGTQNYVCSPSGNGVAFVLMTPQATLFDDAKEQLTSHFFSPNPEEPNANPVVVTDRAIRVTWRHSRDSSTVWGEVKQGNASTDSNFVAFGAVAWLLVTKVHVEDGPTGGDKLSKTTFIHRVNTSGGLAPTTGCNSAADLGHQAFVPYTADYIFYRAPR